MKTVTAIKKQKRLDRMNIYLDGEFGFGLNLDDFLKLNLKVGDQISLDQIQDFTQEDLKKRLTDWAFKFLSYRPRSEKETYSYLKKKLIKISPLTQEELVEEIIQGLREKNYLDDLAFSSWWIDQRIKHRPRGKRLIKNELYQKGIKKEVIDQALSKKIVQKEDLEVNLALELLKKKEKAWKKFSPRERREKGINLLQRKGFSWEVIKKALPEIQA